MWGDIPYTEAFQLEEELLYPAYDSQETLYNTILAELKTAADMFNTAGEDIGVGDFMFEGDIEIIFYFDDIILFIIFFIL